jgi:hypothetical protein
MSVLLFSAGKAVLLGSQRVDYAPLFFIIIPDEDVFRKSFFAEKQGGFSGK